MTARHLTATPRGIGGWLLLLVVKLAVLIPAGAAWMLIANIHGDPDMAIAYGDRWRWVVAYEWALAVVGIAGSWLLAWLLVFRRRAATVRIVIGGIWFLWIGMWAVDLGATSLLSGERVATLLRDWWGQFAISLGYAIAWTLYLLRSRRVAATYASPDAIARTFG